MWKINLSLPRSILIIAGPTASGKSGFALEVADKYDGVIINCDSMQVYSELQIITARPSIVDERDIPHKLYGMTYPSLSKKNIKKYIFYYNK